MDTRQGARAADLMRVAFEGVAARDVEAATQFGDDGTYADFLVLGPIVGKPAIQDFFREFFAAMPDLVFETVRIMEVDENTAVGQWHVRGTFTGGTFRGLHPTGRTIDLRGVDIMEFDSGVLRRNTIYYDGLTFARQVGLLPAEGSTGDHAMMAAFNAVSRAKAAVRTRRG